jgi:hypothetical protein
VHTSTNKKLKLPTCLVSCGGVRLGPLGTSAITWPIVRAPDDGGMMSVEQSVE